MPYLKWGLDELNARYAPEHFMVCGATGSGKSLLLNSLLNSALGGRDGVGRRALIYDPKRELVPLLYGMGLGDRVRILHPFDKRGCAWDMAADIDGPVSAREIASILVPDAGGHESQSFFRDAVRDLLAGVFLWFIECAPLRRTWTFRDVLLTMMYEPYLGAILSRNVTWDKRPFPTVTRLWDSYANPRTTDERTRANIRASISTMLSIYEPVAAAWHHSSAAAGKRPSSRPVSLSAWCKDDCDDVLVLGNDEAARAALDPINAALFKRVSELLLDRREQTQAERDAGQALSWVFLDEVREAGHLDGLGRLMNKGRSRGVCVALGFQDIEGLRDVYGEQVAHEITGQCNNIAVLKMNSPATAEWGADLFGRDRETEQMALTTIAEGKVQIGRQEARTELPRIFTAQLIYLERTSPENGLTGFFRHSRSTHGDIPRRTIPWRPHMVAPNYPTASTHPDHVAFQRRDVSEQYLDPWTRADWDRLGLNCDPPPLKTAPTVVEEEVSLAELARRARER